MIVPFVASEASQERLDGCREAALFLRQTLHRAVILAQGTGERWGTCVMQSIGLDATQAGVGTLKGFRQLGGDDGCPTVAWISECPLLSGGFFRIPIEDSHMVTIESAVRLKGWWATLTTTALLGDPTPNHEVLIRARDETLDAIEELAAPGIELRALSKVIADGARKHSLGIALDLTGHGIGQWLQERPMVDVVPSANASPLQSGQVLSIQFVYAMTPEDTFVTKTARDGFGRHAPEWVPGLHASVMLLVGDESAEMVRA